MPVGCANSPHQPACVPSRQTRHFYQNGKALSNASGKIAHQPVDRGTIAPDMRMDIGPKIAKSMAYKNSNSAQGPIAAF
ncbi:hypothetical protein CSC3H3_13480 [Thalassospira marina]|uniref:Uncharacterized protein n=1 Tax=Thalassospira marina TaxID=2048283 RepID=A0ABM6QAL8_9PROT|nr:hypothetical protein CSC3H3_13480 [Thalassospira marina]